MSDIFDSQEFYELMQAYRFTPGQQPADVLGAFEAVKAFARQDSDKLSKAIDLLKAAHSALDEVMEGRVVFDIAAFLKEVSE